MSRADVCLIIKSLIESEQSRQAIMAAHGLSLEVVRGWLNTLHESGAIHICEWDYMGKSPVPTAIYKLGPGVDAKRPTNRSDFLGFQLRYGPTGKRANKPSATTPSINQTLQRFAAIQKGQA